MKISTPKICHGTEIMDLKVFSLSSIIQTYGIIILLDKQNDTTVS